MLDTHHLEHMLNTSSPGGWGQVTERDLANSAEQWGKSLVHNWFRAEGTPPATVLMRPSSLGRPVWLLGLRLPHIREELGLRTLTEFDTITHRRFHFGNTLEHETVLLLKALSYRVEDEQTDLPFEPDVVGHCDGVLNLGGEGRWVFDVKTMSDNSFREYTREPHDNSGYLTQLACYHEVLKTDGAFLLAYNKNTHQYRVLTISDEVLRNKAHRAHKVCELLRGVRTLDDVDQLPTPPAEPARWRGRPVPDMWVPHPSLKYEPERRLLWVIERGKLHPQSTVRELVTDKHNTIREALTYAKSKQ